MPSWPRFGQDKAGPVPPSAWPSDGDRVQYSPDGSQIAFAQVDHSTSSSEGGWITQLMVMDADGTNLRALTGPEAGNQVRLRPPPPGDRHSHASKDQASLLGQEGQDGVVGAAPGDRRGVLPRDQGSGADPPRGQVTAGARSRSCQTRPPRAQVSGKGSLRAGGPCLQRRSRPGDSDQSRGGPFPSELPHRR